MEMQNDMNRLITLECNKLKELLIEKNKMYGNSFFKTLDEYGNVLMCVRLEDKLNRLKEIVLRGSDDGKTDEKLIDTIMDLAGYALLSKIYLKGLGKKA